MQVVGYAIQRMSVNTIGYIVYSVCLCGSHPDLHLSGRRRRQVCIKDSPSGLYTPPRKAIEFTDRSHLVDSLALLKHLSLIHIPEPTRLRRSVYAVSRLTKKNTVYIDHSSFLDTTNPDTNKIHKQLFTG